MTQIQTIAPKGLAPPRPNLGPEPWSETQTIAGVLLIFAILAGSLVLCWFSWMLLRRRQSRRGRGEIVTVDQENVNPRDRLVALSRSIRETLTVQYGMTWRSKTTEELSSDAQLVQAVGREGFEELIRFLDQVDRIKFAPERSIQHHESLQHDLEIWEPRVADLKARIRAKPAVRRGSRLTDPRSQLPVSPDTPPKNGS